MKELETTSALVKEILITNPSSRNSDNLLFYLVCKKILADHGKNIDEMGFTKLFLSLKEYGLPQFETVGRIRRKLQQTFPDLRCSLEVAINRGMNTDAFIEYAKEGE